MRFPLLLAALLATTPTLAAEGDLPDVAGMDRVGAAELPAPANTPPSAEEAEDLTIVIAKTLRCPTCVTASIHDSPAQGALAMKKLVRSLVGEGYSGDQIRAYFAANYGQTMLLDPPVSGLNYLIWLGPGVVGGVVLVAFATVVARWRREPDEVPLPSDVGLAPKDKYEAQLLAELEDG